MRTLFVGLSLFILGGAAFGQERSAMPKIGVISFGVASSSPHLDTFKAALRDHGYIEGKNIGLEFRFAHGDADRLPALANELVRSGVKVIVTEGVPTALAARRATPKIPIVMAGGADPVQAGLAASLARPGGNVTGLTFTGAQRTAKQLQLIKELLPGATRITAIYNSTRPDIEHELAEARDSARSLGIEVDLIAVRTTADLDRALDAIASARPAGMITIGHGMLLGNAKRIAEFAYRNRIAGVFPEREFAEAGGLMAYGPDIGWNFRRAAAFVDAIMKGAQPAEMPIERPTKWGLVVNLRTAEAIGVKIPGSLLVRADEAIQ